MERPPSAVAVDGDGPLADAVRAALAAQADLTIADGDAAATIRAAPDADGGMVSVSALGRSIGPPDLCALGRVTRAVRGVRHADATVLLPPGTAGEARSGPVNAVRICPPAAARLGDGVRATVQRIVAPHTLCWVVAARLDLEAELDESKALELLGSSRRVVIAPGAFHLDDTASLLDVMHDLERGSRWFFETVVFERSVACSDAQLRLVLAASLGAVAADVVDELRIALTPVRDREEAERRTDRALGILESLGGGSAPARAPELAGT